MTTNISFKIDFTKSFVIDENNNSDYAYNKKESLSMFDNDFENLSFSIENINLNTNSYITYNVVNSLNGIEYKIKSLVDTNILKTLFTIKSYKDYYFEKNNKDFNLIFDIEFN